MKVQLPLFPGYVFTRIQLHSRLDVLQIPGVVCLVGFNAQPTSLRDEEIEVLQKGLSRGICAIPHPYLATGRRVRVKAGPLQGLEGIVIRKKNSLRLVVSLDLIHCAAAVEVEAADLEQG